MLNILTYQNPVFKEGAINVWPHQSHKTELLRSMIDHKRGLSKKLNARDCIITIPNSKTVHDFLEANHIAGSTRSSSYQYGLSHPIHGLVQLLTIGVPRFTKNASLEVLRMASLSGYTVRGGASKLFSHIKEVHTGTLLTYSDNLIGDGAVYKQSGFIEYGETNKGYFWEKDGVVLARYQTMKTNLHKIFDFEIDLSKSETTIMHELGWRIVKDLGNRRWLLELNGNSSIFQIGNTYSHHYVYKIIRNDGHYYYGIHSTNNINDGYMGSGDLIRASIKKHGIDSHRKEIVSICKNRYEACKLEAELVTNEVISDPICMNLIPGGGSFVITDATKNFVWMKMLNVEIFIHKTYLDFYLARNWIKGRLQHHCSGKWYVDEVGRQRRGFTDKPSQRLVGTTTGCTWVTRDGKRRAVKEVLPTDTVGFMPSVSKGKKKVIIDGVQKFVSVDEAVGLPKPPPPNTGKVGMRLGDVKKLVSLDEARVLAKQGWEIATKQLKSAPPQVLLLAQELGMKLPKKKLKMSEVQ